MAALIAWIVTLNFMVAWVAVTSPLWLVLWVFNAPKEARAVAFGPMLPIQAGLQNLFCSANGALRASIGRWRFLFYAVVFVLLVFLAHHYR